MFLEPEEAKEGWLFSVPRLKRSCQEQDMILKNVASPHWDR